MITEDQLEQLSLNWFQNTDWDYVNGVNISPDGDNPQRDDYRVVALKDRLAKAVARLNPDHPSLEQNNRALHRLYTSDVVGRCL